MVQQMSLGLLDRHVPGIFRHEGLADVIVGQVILGTQDHVKLDPVQLLLSVADEVEELAVLLVDYPQLLV